MKRLNSNSGFMGLTHSLSALATMLLLIAFLPTQLYQLIGTDNLLVIALSGVVAIGFSIMLDLDNTNSTAKKTLGIVGDGLSFIMRAISVGIYNITKSKYDDDSRNPHRGFWHTLVSGIFVSIGAYLLMGIKTEIPIGNIVTTVGTLFATLILFVAIQLTIASLMSKLAEKINKNFIVQIAEIIIAGGFAFAGAYFGLIYAGTYLWISIPIAIGWFVHIIGDTLTVSGTPLLWPIARKGKRWWQWRIPPGIKAGGTAEKYIAIPFFVICSAVSAIKIVATFMATRG